MNCIKCDIAKRLRQETDNLQLLREVVGSNPIITAKKECPDRLSILINVSCLDAIEIICVAST